MYVRPVAAGSEKKKRSYRGKTSSIVHGQIKRGMDSRNKDDEPQRVKLCALSFPVT